jgi:hypothetical protein
LSASIGASADALCADNLDLDVRVQVRKTPEHRRQQRRHVVVRRAQHDPPRDLGPHDCRPRFLMQIDHAPRVLEQRAARPRQRQIAGIAGKQRGAEHAFEPLDLHADRRLRAVHRRRGFRETARLDHGDEGAQQIDVEFRVHDL